MRYIRIEDLRAVTGVIELIADAEAALAQVRTIEDPQARKEEIKRLAARWRAFRDALAALSHRKCWYTEAKSPGADWDVDHFRPKGRVAEDEEYRFGYWWLAFDWRNLRLSSQRSNRLKINPESGTTQGKSDHFPLVEETARIREPGDLSGERPMLLDPTDPTDPPLLTYGMNARAAVAPRYAHDDETKRRIQASAIYLYLDWPEFVDERRDLLANILDLIDQGEVAARRFDESATGAKDELSRVSGELIGLTASNKPYSSAAKAFIRQYRTHWWIEAIVMENFE